jgi:hypothetical protein
VQPRLDSVSQLLEGSLHLLEVDAATTSSQKERSGSRETERSEQEARQAWGWISLAHTLCFS